MILKKRTTILFGHMLLQRKFKSIKVAFEMLDNGEKVTSGYQYINYYC